MESLTKKAEGVRVVIPGLPIDIVTGAASGIGRMTAIKYSQIGKQVALIDVDEVELEKTRKSIELLGGISQAFPCDVTDDAAIGFLFQDLANKFDGISSVVNCVGIEITGPTHKMPIKEYDRLFDVNVRSVFICCQASITHMIKQKTGSIVNIASVASFKTWPNDGVYSATKAAVLSLTKAFAVDVASHGIRINSVAPAIVDTPMTELAISLETDRKAGLSKRKALHPLGRLASTEDVANAIVFLNSDQASFITGTCLNVDGGLLS